MQVFDEPVLELTAVITKEMTTIFLPWRIFLSSAFLVILSLLFVQSCHARDASNAHPVAAFYKTRYENNESFSREKSPSPWLVRAITRTHRRGCKVNQATCDDRDPSGARILRCCNHKCVDVGSNPQNCGECGAKCLFGWRCCNGICVDTENDILNCGRCNHPCPPGILCIFGMCGYS